MIDVRGMTARTLYDQIWLNMSRNAEPSITTGSYGDPFRHARTSQIHWGGLAPAEPLNGVARPSFRPLRRARSAPAPSASPDHYPDSLDLDPVAE